MADPHKLLLVTSGVDIPEAIEAVSNSYASNAIIVHITDAQHAERDMLKAIEQQVRTHGTLQTLVIDSHGNSNIISPTSEGVGLFYTLPFLDKLQAMQDRLGVKITNRIQFVACDLMTSETPDWVDYYSRKAQMLGAEIVGNTTSDIAFAGSRRNMMASRDVVFKPNGMIERDRTDAPVTYTVGSAIAKLEHVVTGHGIALSPDGDDSWLKPCLGKNRATCYNALKAQMGWVEQPVQQTNVAQGSSVQTQHSKHTKAHLGKRKFSPAIP